MVATCRSESQATATQRCVASLRSERLWQDGGSRSREPVAVGSCQSLSPLLELFTVVEKDASSREAAGSDTAKNSSADVEGAASGVETMSRIYLRALVTVVCLAKQSLTIYTALGTRASWVCSVRTLHAIVSVGIPFWVL